MRLIDADALRADCDKYNSWDAQIVKAWLDDQPTIEPPTTTWIGNYSPYKCEHCRHYADSKTPYCAWCGRRASNYE